MRAKNYNIKDLNTFGLDITVKNYIRIDRQSDFSKLCRKDFEDNTVILGGGSNIIMTEDFFDGTVIHICNKELIFTETANDVVISAGAGILLDDFVRFCCEKNFWGAENLAKIYGNIGGAVVGNAGAYGVEMKDILLDCCVFDWKSSEMNYFTLSKEQLNYSYRNSCLKTGQHSKIVVSARVKLSKNRVINSQYREIAREIADRDIKSPLEIYEIVRKIRERKLPEPSAFPNSGSFFKNPYVNKEKLFAVKEFYPSVPFYGEKEMYKLSAGWLIEQCGYRNKQVGNVGFGENCLVIINFGVKTGKEILNFADMVICDVKKKFNVELEKEVIIYGKY